MRATMDNINIPAKPALLGFVAKVGHMTRSSLTTHLSSCHHPATVSQAYRSDESRRAGRAPGLAATEIPVPGKVVQPLSRRPNLGEPETDWNPLKEWNSVSVRPPVSVRIRFGRVAFGNSSSKLFNLNRRQQTAGC